MGTGITYPVHYNVTLSAMYERICAAINAAKARALIKTLQTVFKVVMVLVAVTLMAMIIHLKFQENITAFSYFEESSAVSNL